MGKKSIGFGIGQIVVIVLVWILNPNVMVEQINKLLLMFVAGCATGGTAPSIFSFAKSTIRDAWAIAFELTYMIALASLLGLVIL